MAITGNTLANVMEGVVVNAGSVPPQVAGVTMSNLTITGNTVTAATNALFLRALHNGHPNGPVGYSGVNMTGNTVLSGAVLVGRAETLVASGATGAGDGLLNLSGTVTVDGSANADAFQTKGAGVLVAMADAGNDSVLGGAGADILKGGSARFRADCDAMRSSGVPAMSDLQVEALHALASGSIAGAPRSWSESLARIGPAPLPEVDLDDPRSLFGVDPELSVWDGKAWTPRPAAPVGSLRRP